ncbi:hypothetical protein FTUN_0397 [Frigoriglobus tundricola]|uniref:GYF domain-containing protein n=2 Tax=Frigoriglobus tundricola TaxID=2774151 RepID=A0A6M5YHW5_9BACT|nr:hypothetical protein FTUN_0397 [Frigoriglobus tundricola]
MGLWDRLMGSPPADRIEWVEPHARDVVVSRGPYTRFKVGTELTVRDGQVSVLAARGNVADVLGPGRHTLTPVTLPRLAAANELRDASASFRADVFFVSVVPRSGVPWATPGSVVARDADNNPVRAKVSGQFGFVITDPVAFVRETVPGGGEGTGATLAQLGGLIANQFSEIVRTGRLDGADLLGSKGRLGSLAGELLADVLLGIGMTLTDFTVEIVSAPPEVRRPSHPSAHSTTGGSDGYHADVPLPQFSPARSNKVPTVPQAPVATTAPVPVPAPSPQRKSAPVQYGLPSLPAELAAVLEPPLPRGTDPKSVRLPIVETAPEGIFSARQPSAGPKSERLLLSDVPDHGSGESEGPSTELFEPIHPTRMWTPPAEPVTISGPAPARPPPGRPPLPATLEFHVALGGAVVGPFDLVTLSAKVREGALGRKTLVWRNGMDGWIAAENVVELAPLFSAAPPPLPPA